MTNLIDNTVVMHPETGAPTLLAAGGPVPDWATGLVGEHLLDGVGPKAAPDRSGETAEVARLKARIAELERAAGQPGGSSPEHADVPPRSGPGSGADRWRTYAGTQGVDVPDNASREDVIKALESAHKPTE